MGGSLGPVLPNIILIAFYCRYVDDTLLMNATQSPLFWSTFTSLIEIFALPLTKIALHTFWTSTSLVMVLEKKFCTLATQDFLDKSTD